MKYILSSLMIVLLTGCYPGDDFGINVSMQIDNLKKGLCCANITSSYIIHDGNPSIEEVGVCWDEGSSYVYPTIDKKFKKAESVSTPFSILLSDLKEATFYVARPYMKADGFIVYGDALGFRTPSNSEFLPKLGDLLLVNSELDKLVVSSSIATVPSEYPVTEVGVCYTSTTSSNFTMGMSGVSSLKAILVDGKFTVDIENLSFSTSYYVRAYAKNQAGVNYGNIRSFRTAGDEYVPQLGEIEVVENKPTSLKLKCRVSEKIRTDSIIACFELLETNEYYNPQKIEAFIEDGFMVAEIKDLDPVCQYYIIAKAENKFGISSSNRLSVKTKNLDEYMPIIGVPSITGIVPDGGHVESIIKIVDSDYKALSGGFEYSTSNDMYSFESKDAVMVNDTILRVDLSDLLENTTYYVRAFINTGLKKVYSDETSFTTAERRPIISNLKVNTITKTSVDVAAYVKSYDEIGVITEAGIQYTSNTMINDNSTKKVGDIIGDSVKVFLSNLKKDEDYIVRAYAVVGNKIYYSEPADTIKTKSDDDYKPTIDDVVASEVAITSFNLLSGYKLVNQTYNVSEAGFQYYRSDNVNDVQYGKLYAGDVTDGKIMLNLTDLVSGSTYQIRTYVKLDDGSKYYGNTISVVTKKVEDYISDVTVSEILISSAKLKATINELPSNYEVTESGFHYYELSGNYITKEKKIAAELINGSMVLDISSLSRGALHKVRAYIKCSSSTYYGKYSNFITLSASDLPSVVCDDVTAVNTSAFIIEAEVKENNSIYPITEAGFLYIKSTSSSALTLNTNNAVRKSVAIEEGKVKLTVTDLLENSTYLVRAYVMSGTEVTYNEKTIKVYTNMDNYKPSLGTLSVQKSEGNYVVSCTATSSQVFPITECGFVYSTSKSSPSIEDCDGKVTSTISESSFSSAIPFQKPQTGSTTYYVRAYAKNANGISYSSYKSISVSWND